MSYKHIGEEADLNQYRKTVCKDFYIMSPGLKKFLKTTGHLFQTDTGKNCEARDPIHGISGFLNPYNCKEYVYTNNAADKHQASVVFADKGKNHPDENREQHEF